ncbi:hypothetical protein ACGFWI_06030 [Streptomyces sp. NPDC048434]|uniref:hypothetical protein n=1 Tax=Streptomyces sp. NPDC048434 TaxID=3365549 RepID=UPI0037176B3D
MADWLTISQLATAGGTLVLAAATFASVRSANRSARFAERSLLSGLQPLLLPSRMEDPAEKVGFQDDHWVRVPGGNGYAEAGEGAIYLAIALRNVGQGLAVLDGWAIRPQLLEGAGDRPDLADFHRLTRDLYIPSRDRGFWQGTLRDPSEPAFDIAATMITERQAFMIDLLYGDGEGGQRMISRFSVRPVHEDAWLATVSKHWNLDRAEPR